MPGRKKYGYFLLLFLVFSGLAGTPTDNSLNKKERKFAADNMKGSKADLNLVIKGLNKAQLNFKKSRQSWSIKECIYHIAISERNIWAILEKTMKAPANPEKRGEIKMTDEQVIKIIEDRNFNINSAEFSKPVKKPYKSLDEALNDFKTNRANHIKYMKGTTEDMRNHVVQLSFGWIDCYQLCLFMSANTNWHTQQINELKKIQGIPGN